jgi:hypothetical protein
VHPDLVRVVERAIQIRTSGFRKACARLSGVADPFNGHIDAFRISHIQRSSTHQADDHTRAGNRRRLAGCRLLGSPRRGFGLVPSGFGAGRSRIGSNDVAIVRQFR